MDKLSNMMTKMLNSNSSSPSNKPITIIEVDNILDIDHKAESGIMMDHHIDKTLEEITLEKATEIMIEEGVITIKISINIRNFSWTKY